MPMLNRVLMVSVAAVALGACAQNSAPPAATSETAAVSAASPNIMPDLMKDVEGVEKKMMDLAKAMPEGSMGWRPAAGVRSVKEVMLHVAGDNYLIPALLGATIPPATGIVSSDYKTVETYEKRDVKKDQAVADMQESFTHLKNAMTADANANMSGEVDFFNTKMSRQAAWIGTVTHLHEHLGQAIAYARSNKIVPPWSK